MDPHSRVDPQLQPSLDLFNNLTGGKLDLNGLDQVRTMQKSFIEMQLSQLENDPEISISDRVIVGPSENHNLSVRHYLPKALSTPSPALLWIHGGGMVFGQANQDEGLLIQISKSTGCQIFSVEYRLAPEHPYPAPMDDCYAALQWLHQTSAELGIDSNKIVVGGPSAGGGLTAGLCLLARDRGVIPIASQILLFPMIDDRNVFPASETTPDTLIWTRANNQYGWNAYLKNLTQSDEIPIYAAPSRNEDFSKLPPTCIITGELDLFLEENLDYANRLWAVGVPTALNLYPGAYHGFINFAPEADISVHAVQAIITQVKAVARKEKI